MRKKGYKHSEITKRKISMTKKGHATTKETRKKISESLKGNIPWNKGKKTNVIPWNKGKKMSEKYCKTISESLKGQIPWIKGKKHSEESKRRMSESHKGQISWSKNTKGLLKSNKTSFKKGQHVSPQTEFKKGQIPWIKGKKYSHTEEFKEKMRFYWHNPEFRKKVLGRRLISTLELKFNAIIQKYALPYKFVGNGDFFIERLNPDFINTNGEKIAIEVFYKNYKNMTKRGGLNNWKLERNKIFAKYGWRIIYLDETEVNEETVLKMVI